MTSGLGFRKIKLRVVKNGMACLADICMKHKYGINFKNYKNVAELGHSDLLPVFESNFAEMPISLLLKMAENI